MLRWALALLVGMGVGSAPSAAQTLSDPLVPRGRVRVDFTPSARSWEARYGVREEGGRPSAVEEALGEDLTDPRGVALFPGMAKLEETLRALSGEADFQGVVGATSGRLSREVTRLDMGLRVGVFDWLNVGANLPYVRGRSAVDFVFRADPDANLGLTPGGTDVGRVADLLSALGESAVAAQNRAQGICASGGGVACQSATALAQRAMGFWEGLAGAYFATPFFPLASSRMAAGLRTALTALEGELAAAGLPRVGKPLLFAAAALSEQEYLGLATNPSAGVGASPLVSDPGMWRLGDVEVNATVRLLDGERREEGALSPRYAWSVAGSFLVRLPTGTLNDPDSFLDLASGDGQLDMEGSLDVLVRVGPLVALRGRWRQGVQESVDIVRRVAPHEAPFPQASTLRAVRWTPGSYSLLELSPRLHISEAAALAVDYRRFDKSADSFELLGDEAGSVSAVDVSVLSRETEVALSELALGFRYSSLSAFRAGRVGSPAEVGLRWIVPLSGSGGRTPKATTVEFSVSLFRRLWG